MKAGQDFLHYRIISRLGEGGMGVVYKAEDTRLGRTVALKILRKDLATDEDWNRRFQREVRAASAVSHPGIATLYDYHRDGATAFFTMEFVEGKNLRQVLEEGPIPLPRVLQAGRQLAEALAEAHRRGVVHRDLKPENVMSSESGYYKILDFGLARFDTAGISRLGSADELETISRNTTQMGKLVGTITYMSPEQAQGTTADARSDIFTFGSLLHELATGKAPFVRNTPIATFHAIVHEEPEPVSGLRPEAPEQLDWVVARCLMKRPDDRYQSATDLAADLRALEQESASGIRRIAPTASGKTPRRRREWLPAGAVILLVALAAILLPRWWEERASSGPDRSPVMVVPSDNPAGRSVVVAPFMNNTGEPQLDWLSRGMPEMLTTELAGAPNLRVISTQRLDELRGAARPDGEALENTTIMELARWAGASILVNGAIFRTDGQLRIDVQATDTVTGSVLTAAKVEGKDVFAMVEQITGRLREALKLEERPGTMVAAAAMTDSEDAFRYYTDGMKMYEELRFEEGIEKFRQSLEADPKFALAGMRLGMSLYLQGQKDEATRLIGETARLAEQLPDRERRLVKIWKHYFEGDGSGSSETELEAFSREYPEDQEVYFWKAQARADREGDRVGAIRELSRVVEIDPSNLQAVAALAIRLAELGLPDDAQDILEKYQTRYPDASESIRHIILTLEESELDLESSAEDDS